MHIMMANGILKQSVEYSEEEILGVRRKGMRKMMLMSMII
jgi:hypothetical protein